MVGGNANCMGPITMRYQHFRLSIIKSMISRIGLLAGICVGIINPLDDAIPRGPNSAIVQLLCWLMIFKIPAVSVTEAEH